MSLITDSFTDVAKHFRETDVVSNASEEIAIGLGQGSNRALSSNSTGIICLHPNTSDFTSLIVTFYTIGTLCFFGIVGNILSIEVAYCVVIERSTTQLTGYSSHLPSLTYPSWSHVSLTIHPLSHSKAHGSRAFIR